MTPPHPVGLQHIGAMSSSRVILGELRSSRARLPSQANLSINRQIPFVQLNPANGKQGLLTLSHSRGSPQGK